MFLKCGTLKRVNVIICVILCLSVISSLSAFSAAALEREEAIGGGAAVTGQAKDIGYQATLYNAGNGLPTSEANVVYSSSDGFIWIGGYSGLIRYDGTSFERQDSSGGITSVNTLFEDSSGRLWVGTNDNGVVCMYKDHSEHYSYSEGILSTSIDAFAEDDNGNILVGTKQGIYYFDKDMQIGVIADSPLKEAYISQLYKDGLGAICGVTKSGAVFRIKDLRLTDYYNGSDLGLDEITSVLPAKDEPGRVWLGTNSGLICIGSFNDGFALMDKIQVYYYEETPSEGSEGRKGRSVIASEPVNCIRYASGRVWVLMNSNVFFTDEKGGFKHLEKIPLDGGIENMTEDFEGNIWIASRRQGVMEIAANKFYDLTGHAGLEPRIVNTTHMHGSLIYIGTDTGLQIIDSRLISITNELTDYLGSTRIRCITEDGGGNLWFSTYNNDLGLICYTPGGEIISYTEAEGMPSNKIRCTAVAPDGSVLAGTNGGLAVIKNGKVERVINENRGLSNTVLLTVEATEDGRYYLGSDGDGVYVIDGNNITNLSHDDGLTSDVILRIRNDAERGVIWLITSNSIEYIKDGTVHAVRGFPYTNNYDIYFDKSGNAWVFASNGLYVANAQDLIEKDDFDYVFYNVSDGLPSVPTGNSFSYLGDNGDLYISGREGVSRVNIDSYFAQTQDIRFSVQYIEDENSRYYPDENGTFQIPPSAENITIYCYALTYLMNDPQIQYYLEGADNKPIIVNKSDMVPVRYTNLGGGTYEYELSLIDGSTHTVRQTVSFRIVKRRAFYEQWWFYALCSVLALVLTVGVIALAVRQYLRRKTAIFRLKEEEQRKLQHLFKQTVTALVNAIDAKDRYTHGHSRRVAEYSKKIAELSGKSPEDVQNIYLAAIMHDVGKIGIPDAIINKEGKLSDEEYAATRQHPEIGGQILSGISYSPYLSIGANYHHERYDGKGYPEHLKGEDIPEAARIIAVADAYDAMTSKRSYRAPIPQQLVREEMVKGIGTQFDPEFAKIMTNLIDADPDYRMKEQDEVKELSGGNVLHCGEYKADYSDGIHIAQNIVKIHLRARTDDGYSPDACVPSLLLFDSLDGRVHLNDKDKNNMLFFEYAEVRLDGLAKCLQARKVVSATTELISFTPEAKKEALENGLDYDIEAKRYRDHVLIRILTKYHMHEIIVANPDCSRYTYLSLTGEHCSITNVNITSTDWQTLENEIPRIAEEISYVAGAPVGDVPNVQVDNCCTDATAGIPVADGMKLTFHAMSLPTARLIWHCPYVILFYSEDGRYKGKNYQEFSTVRFDGESRDKDGKTDNRAEVKMGEDFKGWNDWKALFKEGLECEVSFKRDGNKVTLTTENGGIYISCTTSVNPSAPEIYAALSGDQTALTNIRIEK